MKWISSIKFQTQSCHTSEGKSLCLCPRKSANNARSSVSTVFECVTHDAYTYQIYGTPPPPRLIRQRLLNACISPTVLSHIKLIQHMETLLQPTCSPIKPPPPVCQRDDSIRDLCSLLVHHTYEHIAECTCVSVIAHPSHLYHSK